MKRTRILDTRSAVERTTRTGVRNRTVEDTRHGNPFDAIAWKDGSIRYLEAKGTETAGRSVTVTSGEVAHARAHPGECVLGVLSDVRIDAEGK